MGILGKIVGGTLGFAIGGPLGAIAGTAFGHVFDKSGEVYDQGQKPGLSVGESTQLTFYVAAFSMLAKLVQVDGQAKQEEINSVEQFMIRDLNLDPYGQRITKNIFFTALRSPQRFEDFAYQFYSQFHAQPQFLELMIDILFRVAAADGNLNPGEENLIHAAVRIFQFNEKDYQKIRQKYTGVVDKSYAILGCDKGDPDEVIKSRYRKLVSDYHPDKIASKGLPDEFIKFANAKFQEIQTAYEDIKNERNIK